MNKNRLLTLSAVCILSLCSCGQDKETKPEPIAHNEETLVESESQVQEQQQVLEEALVTKECEHIWDEGAIISRASCTSNGEIVYTCTLCNETRLDVSEASGHEMTKHDAVPATENNDGFKEYYTCSHEPGVYYKDIEGLEKYSSYEEVVEITPGKRPDVFVGYDFDAKEVKSVCLMNNYLKQYYDATNDSDEYELIHFLKGDKTVDAFGVDNPENGTQNLGIKWKDDDSENYKVYFATNKLFTNYNLINTKRNYLNDGVLMPGKTYYYCVYGEKSNNALDFGTIDVESEGVRYVYVPADSITKVGDTYEIVEDDRYTCGLRDMGGWNSTYGMKTPYGRIYRGAQLHGALTRGGSSINEEGKRIASEELGIKTEIDLRGQSESDQTSSYIPGANYEVVGIGQYAGFFEPTSKDHIEKLLKIFGNEENYPVFFHCTAGADRTGTISFMLNSLLGVNEVECIKDYEIKSFAKSGGIRYRDYHTAQNPSGGYDGTFEAEDSIYAILNKFKTLYPTLKTLPELTYAVLTDYVGVDHALIDAFINLNLGKDIDRNSSEKTVTFLNCDFAPIKVKSGYSLGTLRAPEMKGYVFDHFEDEDGNLYNPTKPITEDMNLVAKWKLIGGEKEDTSIARWDIYTLKQDNEFVDDKENAKVEKQENAWRGTTLLYTRSQVKNDYYASLPVLPYKNAGKISFTLTAKWESHTIYIDDVLVGTVKHNITTKIDIIDGVVYADGIKKGTISYNALFGFAAPKLHVQTSKLSGSSFVEVTEIMGSLIDYETKIEELANSLNEVKSINDVTIDDLNNYKEYLKLIDSLTTYEKERFVDKLNADSKTVFSSLVKTIKFYDWGVCTGTYYVESGTSLEVSNPDKHGQFDFAYWGNAQGNYQDITSLVSSDMSYYAYYMYTSKLDGNIKFAQRIFNVTYDSYPALSTYFGDDEIPSLNTKPFVRPDYSFKYWSTDSESVDEQIDTSKPLEGDVTLYAVWENNTTHELEILENGGINFSIKVTYEGIGTFDYMYGVSAEQKEAPVHVKGYNFAYWALNGEKYDFSTPLEEDITLSPKYLAPSDEITEYSYVACNVTDQLAYCKDASKNDPRNTNGIDYCLAKADATHGNALQFAGRKAGILTYYYTLPKCNFSNYPLITFEIKNSWRVGSFYLEDGSVIKENVSTSTFFTVSIKNGNMYCGSTLVKEGLDSDILNGSKSLVLKFVCNPSGTNDEVFVFDYKAYNKIVGLDD